MTNPLVKRDLIDSILELREDVERQLKANKYYIALHKLDELLEAIRPLEIPASAEKAAEAEPATESQPEAPAERVWSGVVQESVADQGWQPAVPQAAEGEQRVS